MKGVEKMDALLEAVKIALRVDGTALDDDINDSILACRADLKLSGVTATLSGSSTDALITRAVKLFCRAEYSSDDKESTRYRNAFEALKIHLTLSSDYTTEVVA